MRTMARGTVSYQLAAVIEARGLTAYALGQLAGVDQGVVRRWLSGERDIRLGTADKLAAALGLRLAAVGKPRRDAARNPSRSGPDSEGVGTAPGPATHQDRNT